MTLDEMYWKQGYGELSTFRAYKHDPTDLHSAWFLVMPGGSMVEFNHCDPDAVDEARVRWIAAACNAALAAVSEADEHLAWFVDANQNSKWTDKPNWVQVWPGDPMWSDNWKRYELRRAIMGPSS